MSESGQKREDMGVEVLLLQNRIAELEETLRREGRGVITEEQTRWEEILRASCDEAPHLAGILDLDGKLRHANRTACALIGKELSDVIGLALWETPWWMHCEDEQEKLRDGVRRAARESVHFETIHRAADGALRHIDMALWPVSQGTGAMPFLMVEGRDITGRKIAEEALRTRTQQLDALRLVSAEITRELDLNRLLELIHRRAAELLGVGAGLLTLYDETSQALTLRSWVGHGDWVHGLSFRIGEGISGSVAAQRRGMVVNDYRNSQYAIPLILENTTVTSIVAEPLIYRDRLVGVVTVDNQGMEARTFMEQDLAVLNLFAAQAAIAVENARLFETAQRELAERYRAEKALRESEELYRTLIEASPDPIIMFDLEGRILAVSAQTAKNYGAASVEEFLREVKTVFDVLTDESKALAAANFQNTLAAGVSRKSEYSVRLRDGNEIPVEINSSTLCNADGEPSAFISVLRDITNRKRSERIMIAQRDLGLSLVKATSLPEALRLCLDAALTATGFDGGGIYTMDQASGDFKLACFHGVSDRFAQRVNHYASASDRARLVMQGRPLYIEGTDDLAAYNEGDIIEEGLRSVAVIPIGNKDMIIGSLNIGSRVFDSIPEYSRNALETIASQIGTSIVRLYAEEALRESEGKFRDLAEKSMVGIYLIQDGLFRYANSEFADICGYRIEEMIDLLGPKDVIFPEDLPLVEENIGKRISGELESLRYEFRILTVGAQVRHGEVYSSRTMYRGKPAIIGTLLDITDRRKAEEELRRLSIAIEQAAEDIIITDPEGVIQYVNPAFEKITGYSRREAIGQNPRIMNSGVHKPVFFAHLWNTIKNGNIWRGRITNRCKDGKLIQEDATISPLLTSNGKLTGYVALKRDVTEAVRIEDHLRQAQKMEAIGTLAGGIAHDFNNILGAIMGYAELAKFKTADAKIYPYLEQILKACDRSRDLVQQILTFSRRREQEKKPVAVTPIVKEALKLLRSSLPATVEIRQSYDSRQDTVLADPTQIHQVLMNLCTNAVHAMREREGVLEVRIGYQLITAANAASDPELKEGAYLRLVVGDTGMGIDPAIKDKIFEPFFTTKGSGEGTGLGLSVVYGIVKDHGGIISVESEPGIGTIFTICLPLILAEEGLKEQKIVSLPRGEGRILYVEDEEAIAALGREMLSSLGYDVIVHFGSRDALEDFRSHPERFDLMITDMTMPNMTGASLATEVLKMRPGFPIILTTGFSERINEGAAKRIGIREFLMKPVSLPDLAWAVKRIMDQETPPAGS